MTFFLFTEFTVKNLNMAGAGSLPRSIRVKAWNTSFLLNTFPALSSMVIINATATKINLGGARIFRQMDVIVDPTCRGYKDQCGWWDGWACPRSMALTSAQARRGPLRLHACSSLARHSWPRPVRQQRRRRHHRGPNHGARAHTAIVFEKIFYTRGSEGIIYHRWDARTWVK